MRSSSPTSSALMDSGAGLAAFARRQAERLGGLALILLSAAGVGALATWNVQDPSFSHATDNPVTNALGYPGAVYSDIAMQFFGLGALITLLPLLAWGILLLCARGIDRLPKRAPAWLGASILTAGITGCIEPPASWPLPSGLGGVFGDVVLKLPSLALGGYPTGIAAMLIAVVLAGPALWLLAFASGITGRQAVSQDRPASSRKAAEEDDELYAEDEDDEQSGGMLALGAIAHWWLSGRAWVRRHFGRALEARRAEPAVTARREALPVRSSQRIEPGFDAQPAAPAHFEAEEEFAEHYDEAEFAEPEEIAAPVARQAPATRPGAVRVEAPAARPVQGTRAKREAQPSMLSSDGYEMPPIHFLAEPKNVAKDPALSKDALEQNARLLEGVLEDFGVKGEIIHVRPGPVVTLYELEPAPGIKSSRVIGLADDIARSMSAIACRVAVVPGRNAIGIELPNAKRETVYLREILASRDFEQSKHKLALALGKTINGEAVTVDIAKMPHVLVAGTTGSGKSVAINTMILSLVYRMTPDQCRLIMVDPKMVELSVYDGIPHLLTPVVTEPKKAVVALKWTVREMEDRYRKMAKLGVRNQEGFNLRVAEAQAKGETLKRTVQTGFDRQTGEAIYETEELDLEPMPFIVVIIDEVADLMMVAGKDIEGAVQRLGQMARAAGIHVIMATQRPSVDVITGTIKANFPTRMSFQVTSKIDSRTILGEQGAEQLLGMGDMLYMAGGGRIQRVHGPFVSDGEVEKVVSHLKLQGVPQYLDAITEDDGDDDEDGGGRNGSAGGGVSGVFEESEDPYDQAVAVVLQDGKVSTSYIQRRLGIGYNRAASIIEKMEKEGIVGPANHAGKREILVPTEKDKM
ncbi:DNA translocase FtsK [Mesorhizobium australicum]|uniref:DNA translocase FtsK n=1 Tax=Mesorhizobium australicum TaxID=536018 RepID=A0A1X7Q004_9HYPH|nr:DNA translocase FtsK [Mesorhizobium australicum]SMH57789.1 DNA segregation ATPase FtsK/SpoIIIE, S-DNA-T family [Mesorhizobium australicum]